MPILGDMSVKELTGSALAELDGLHAHLTAPTDDPLHSVITDAYVNSIKSRLMMLDVRRDEIDDKSGAVLGRAGREELRQVCEGLRIHVEHANALADGDSNDAEIEAWIDVRDAALRLAKTLQHAGVFAGVFTDEEMHA